MNLVIKLLLNALAVYALSYILSGVSVDAPTTAIIVAVIISLLNLFVKPILVILTLPITIVTLGLFLLFINACIILLADKMVNGFAVNSIWWAILFSVLLSVLQSILHALFTEKKNN